MVRWIRKPENRNHGKPEADRRMNLWTHGPMDEWTYGRMDFLGAWKTGKPGNLLVFLRPGLSSDEESWQSALAD
jgi:hypothetical protein